MFQGLRNVFNRWFGKKKEDPKKRPNDHRGWSGNSASSDYRRNDDQYASSSPVADDMASYVLWQATVMDADVPPTEHQPMDHNPPVVHGQTVEHQSTYDNGHHCAPAVDTHSVTPTTEVSHSFDYSSSYDPGSTSSGSFD